MVEAANITDDPSNAAWREVIGAVVFSGRPADMTCLDELGRRFDAAGLSNAAHAW